ncbi:type II toxin-antitoxin system Phd/YefM family antitoxin [Actinophytocola gossypii]|uniref:Antitoxin n=1 Tax=Actinophytocola gossypii TaxID=2812003 RepID=A0ABT2J3C8_9PSEU|nr:type II toxin-antitoxin system prevent-host-death family antitoxin [Actinophytocola gossypii]MCT2582358.1 type II toxin-antitoxin system prevent-host-death family antitoxin [Actinophytocola gossypii]
METIGLRELNQNPSRAVARVRAGNSILVTDRGRPVLRMVPEPRTGDMLHQLVANGEVRAPAQSGMPDVVDDLVPETESLTDLLIADRDRERNR